MSFIHRLSAYPLVQLVIEIIILVLVAALLVILNVHVLHVNIPLVTRAAEAITIFIVFLFARIIERRSFSKMGWSLHHAGRDLFLGFLVGGCFISVVIGIMALFGWYHVTGLVSGSQGIALVLEGLVSYLFVGLFEEGLFRGVIFRLTEEALGSWIALVFSAVLFGITHLLNQGATLLGALAIALEAGVMLAAIYMLTRSLWAAIGVHWAWDFFEGPIFGANDSAIAEKGLVHSTISGPILWTGGSFGPEAGLVALTIGFMVGIIVLILAVKRHHMLPPPWMRKTSSHIPPPDPSFVLPVK